MLHSVVMGIHGSRSYAHHPIHDPDISLASEGSIPQLHILTTFNLLLCSISTCILCLACLFSHQIYYWGAATNHFLIIISRQELLQLLAEASLCSISPETSTVCIQHVFNLLMVCNEVAYIFMCILYVNALANKNTQSSGSLHSTAIYALLENTVLTQCYQTMPIVFELTVVG